MNPLDDILGTDHGTPCLSLYQPTHRSFPDNRQDPIRFRNLVKTLDERLREADPAADANALLAPFHALAEDRDFWNHAQDALAVLGISASLRLVLPRVLALACAMPLLVVWTDALALWGGMIAADRELGIPPSLFLSKLPDVVPVSNLWLGVEKGAAFGVLIGIIACHFGLRVEPNTQSLGAGTTRSVVASITAVILADALFAIMTSRGWFG